jgi:hypothetical protein
MSVDCNTIHPDEGLAYVEHALTRLREAGLRITEPRKQVVQVLAGTRKPLRRSCFAQHAIA